jgi:hypothetical protein
MKLMIAVIIALALTASAHADSLIGAIAVPRQGSMVCEKAEDVLPANAAWSKFVAKQISVDEFDKWMTPCGLIKSGKAALVRDEMKMADGGTLVCVQIYENVESAEHYAHNTDKCFWSTLNVDAYVAVQQGRRVGSPADKLFQGYWRYILVKYCHDVREGYLVKNINDVEMDRAEKAIKAIVDRVKADDASVDTNKQWDKAIDYVRQLNVPASIGWCQRAKEELFQLSPKSVYTIAKPE